MDDRLLPDERHWLMAATYGLAHGKNPPRPAQTPALLPINKNYRRRLPALPAVLQKAFAVYQLYRFYNLALQLL
jgi:hypothetical protein